MSSTNYTLESGFDEAQGRRDTMEDAHCVINDAKNHPDLSIADVKYNAVSFYGVFDGHGGVDAAQMVEKMLHKNIFSSPDFRQGDIKKAINDGFQATDAVIVEESNKRGWMNGSTCVAAVLVDYTLYVANIGDSEAVLVRQTDSGALECEAMTVPHKASDPSEKKRIESLGGHVFFGRVFGALAVSRSFGDSKFKTPKTSQNFVSWEPAIQTRVVDPSHKFLILACDGLWDVMKHEEAADFVNKQRLQGKNANEVAKALVREALNKRTEDNVTIVVVFFSWSADASAPVTADTGLATAQDVPSSPSTPAAAPAEGSASVSVEGAFPSMDPAPASN